MIIIIINSNLTSLPTVMEAMTFLTASFFRSFLSLFNSARNSNISPIELNNI